MTGLLARGHSMNPSLKYGVWYGNGTCDADLECNSQLECVVGSPSSGGTPGTDGGTGGSPPATGGTVGSGGSVVTTGGTSSASGGDTASGGSTSCGDTSSDSENCGECGHVCESSCEDGQCRPALVGCFEEDSGLATCDEYCPSIGETCSEECGVAASAWASIDLAWCENDEDPYSYVSKCDDPLPYSDNNAIYRCCCTDS